MIKKDRFIMINMTKDFKMDIEEPTNKTNTVKYTDNIVTENF